MSIGDSNNDIPMTYVVNTSVAVKESTPLLENYSTIKIEEDLGTYLNKLAQDIQKINNLKL